MDYYKIHNRLQKIIVITPRYYIKDGYADYLTALSYGLNEIECDVCCKPEVSQSSLRRRKIRKKLYEKSGGICSICGKKLQIENYNYDDFMTIDHIIPVSLGGKTELKNLQGTCYKCNLNKGNSVDKEAYRQYLKAHQEYTETEIELLVSSIKKGMGLSLTENSQKKVSMCW
jgi:CRISPR/Cas system Type II protein with McrA/HNH and RuvC-like nuclease domain